MKVIYILIILGIFLVSLPFILSYFKIVRLPFRFFLSLYHSGDALLRTIHLSDAYGWTCPYTELGHKVTECDVYTYTTTVLFPGDTCTYPQCSYVNGADIEIWGYPCTPGYLDEYRCSGNYRQRKFQYADCSTVWINYEYCDYGCSNGRCNPAPTTTTTTTTIPPEVGGELTIRFVGALSLISLALLILFVVK